MVNICLFATFLFKITFLTRKWNIYIVILQFHAFVATYYQAILGFANRTTISFLDLRNTLVSVTIRMLFQRAIKMEVTWHDVTVIV